jgi:hypothetical protein
LKTSAENLQLSGKCAAMLGWPGKAIETAEGLPMEYCMSSTIFTAVA